MGVASAGNVAARGVHRNQFLTGHQTAHQLHLKFTERVALALGKVSYPLVGKGNVCANCLRYPFDRLGNIGLTEQDLAVVAIELAGITFNRIATLRFDLSQHALHRLSRSGINSGLGRACFFEVFGAHGEVLLK